MGNNARAQYQTANLIAAGYAPGLWYLASSGGDPTAAAGAVLIANSLRLMAFVIRDLVDLQALGARITTLSAGGNIQFGVYAAQMDTLRPMGGPLARTGSIGTDAAGLVNGVLTPVRPQLRPGVYFFALNADATAAGTAIMQVELTGSFGALIGGLQSIISNAAGSLLAHLSTPVTFGSWPDLTASAAVFTQEFTGTGCLGHFQVANQ